MIEPAWTDKFTSPPPRPNGGSEAVDPTHEHGRGQGTRLLLTMGLNLLIPSLQVMGGLLANSTALLADAIHNFSDFAGILIAYVALRIGRREPSVRNTFGYHRAEILAAFINSVVLVGATVLIVQEAVHRLARPEAVSGGLVMALAGVGVVGNGLSAWLLHHDAKTSLNMRGAFLHMLGDMLTSVAVLVNGLILMFKPWYWLDPIFSFLIVFFILKNVWLVLKESTVILMNAAPEGVDVREIKKALEAIPGVRNAHHLHVWSLGATGTGFSGHVVVADQPVSATESLAGAIRQRLRSGFGIDHPVLQFETTPCGNGEALCEGPLKG